MIPPGAPAYRWAASLSLPGLVAPASVVPSIVPLPVPALGVMPAENPVRGDAPAPGLLLASAADELVRLADPSWDSTCPFLLMAGLPRVLDVGVVVWLDGSA